MGGRVGGGSPEAGDLVTEVFGGCWVGFPVEFRGSVGFLGAPSFYPKFCEYQSVV